MIGERIRGTRLTQQRSLSEVAAKARVSVATLSRIENGKQGLDLGLFLTIARVLKTSPQELITDETDGSSGHDPLVEKIASLGSRERAALWRRLAEQRKGARQRRSDLKNLAFQVDELMAQTDFLRQELDSMRQRLRRR